MRQKKAAKTVGPKAVVLTASTEVKLLFGVRQAYLQNALCRYTWLKSL
jgi:hypothetical protein